jgi:dihydroorotase
VTTNSDSGVTILDDFFPVFAAMEKVGPFEFRVTYLEVLKLRPAKYDLVLNLHGEVADISGHGDLSHEEAFLPTLMSLHQRFPNLRIVLEHCTTTAALAAVRACGPSVAGTLCFPLDGQTAC